MSARRRCEDGALHARRQIARGVNTRDRCSARHRIGLHETVCIEGKAELVHQLDLTLRRMREEQEGAEQAASLSVWGIAPSIQHDTSMRYAVRSTRNVAYLEQMDLRSDINPRMPTNAKYFVYRIFYGQTYDEVLYGQQTALTGGVAATFLTWSVRASALAASNTLHTTSVSRGLRPVNGAAIVSQNAAQASANFALSGDPVPILVEYKPVPNVPPPRRHHLDWR
jgi:hypothetical protein